MNVQPMHRRTDIAYLFGVGMGLLGLFGLGFVDLYLTRTIASNDFSGIWAGGRAVVMGINPYDSATWMNNAVRWQNQVPATEVYGYPAWAALTLAPLGLLTVEAASLIWVIGGVTLALLALRALLREFVPGLPRIHLVMGFALLFSQPGITSFYNGQWSFLLVALLSILVLSFRRGHGVKAGLLAIGLLAKPQLFLLAAPALARTALRRKLRLFIPIAAGGVFLVLAVSAVLLPGWQAAYLPEVAAPRLPTVPYTTTFPTALNDLFGIPGLIVGALAIIGATLLALQFNPRGDAYLAVWIALSISVAPYSWSYDQLLLLVPVVVACGVLARHSANRATALALSAAAVLVAGGIYLHGIHGTARGSESYNGLLPALIVAPTIALLWPYRRSPLNSRHQEIPVGSPQTP